MLVNGRFVDPVRIKLPRGRALDGNTLTAFERERNKVDGMMSRSAKELTEAPQAPTRREASSRRR